MSKNPIRMPPVRSPSPVDKIGDPEAAARFIRGDAGPAETPPAGQPAPQVPKSPRDEWESLDDQDRGKVKGALFNMRLTAREEAIINYITKRTPFSKHGLIVAALRPALAERIKALTGEDIAALLASPEDE